MSSKYLEPSAKGRREPTSNTQDNGLIVNPPRLNQMGGLDKIHEKYGHFKNRMSIKKPGK